MLTQQRLFLFLLTKSIPLLTYPNYIGQAGLGPDTAVNTFSTFNVKTNVWTAASPFPAATVATESPVKTTGMENYLLSV